MQQMKQFTKGNEQQLEEVKNQTSGKISKQVKCATKELSVSEQYPFM